MDRKAFPRASWPPATSYPSLPMVGSPNLEGRTLWAAYRASKALNALLEKAGTKGIVDVVDPIMYRLAVFDKVYEV